MLKTAGGDKDASIAVGAHKQAAKIAHFRQLCALGLGGQIIMPALLRTLDEILPYDAGAFCWADDRGQASNRCEECPGEPANPPHPAADMVLADGLPGWPARLPACQPATACAFSSATTRGRAACWSWRGKPRCQTRFSSPQVSPCPAKKHWREMGRRGRTRV
jgi:hypothetical protein